jgi:hypothetical protein
MALMGIVLVRVAVTTDERRVLVCLEQLPYAGMIRIRFKGTLSAPAWEHPRFIGLSFKHSKAESGNSLCE